MEEDTLKYIKMCEKADKDLTYEFKEGDLYVCIVYDNPTTYQSSIEDISIVGHYKHPQIDAPALNLQKAMDKSKPRGALLCRIHRQDQLQKMISFPNSEKIGIWFEKHIAFYEWCGERVKNKGLQNNWGEFESMEQLWLAFVMHEKHHKIWGGEDWYENGS